MTPAAASGLTGSDLALAGIALVLLVVVVLTNLARTSLTLLTRTRAEALAESGRRPAVALADLLRRNDRDFHSPVAVLMLGSLCLEASLAGALGYRWLGAAGLVVVSLVNAVAVFVLAVSAPRTWATLHPERAATMVARPVRSLVRWQLVGRLTRLVIRFTNAVVPGGRLEKGPYARSEIGPDEETSRSGVIAHSQWELVESIAEFADTVAREVMSPRPDMVTVTTDFRVADVVEVSLLNGFSRMPVCGRSIDDVVGLVYSKDLMRAERDGRQDRRVGELVRPAPFVPETVRLPELLRKMQQQHLHMAIVVDEYGSTAGLVTLEDILEELVGDILDEFDVADEPIEPLPGGSLLVRGRTPITAVNDRLEGRLPEGGWDTVGGLVYASLGHAPVMGETVEVRGWRLTVERIQGRRIAWVRVSPVSPPVGSGSKSAPTSEASDVQGAGRQPDDRGVAGGAEVLLFAVLTFVVVTLLVANVWAVVDAKFAVDAAAREAARYYVEAEVVGPGTSGPVDGATEAGLAALAAHGRDRSQGSVELTSLVAGPGAPGSAGFTRCARVVFTATYKVPALTLPWIGGFGHGFEVRSRHEELVDPYRDGVPGSAEGCG